MALNAPSEPIVCGTVVVRRLRDDDVTAYARAFEDDPDLARLLGMETDPDESWVRARIERLAAEDPERRAFEMAIADARSDEFCGSFVLHSFSPRDRRAEIGFWVIAAARRRGIARAAVGAMIDWCFADLGLRRVEMTTTPENPALPPFAARLGFRHEGTLRARSIEQGRAVDILWFGLLRDEWRTR